LREKHNDCDAEGRRVVGAAAFSGARPPLSPLLIRSRVKPRLLVRGEVRLRLPGAPFLTKRQNEWLGQRSAHPNWLLEIGGILLEQSRSVGLVPDDAIFDTFDPTGISTNQDLRPLGQIPQFVAQICSQEEAKALARMVASVKIQAHSDGSGGFPEDLSAGKNSRNNRRTL